MNTLDKANHPIEVFKFCPKCGSKELSFKFGRAFDCMDCGFEYFFNAAGAVLAVIFNEKGELLVVRRAIAPFKDTFDFPGGFIDPGESAEDSLIRELREELDVEVKEYEFCFSIPNQYPYSGIIISTVDMVFKVTIKDFEGIKAYDDVSEVRFVHPSVLHEKYFGIETCNIAIKKLGLI